MVQQYIYHSAPKEATNISRVTIAGQYDGNTLKIAASRCSKKDNFSRIIGRRIALGRLTKGKYYDNIPMEKCNNADFIRIAEEASKDIIENPQKLSNL